MLVATATTDTTAIIIGAQGGDAGDAAEEDRRKGET